MTLANIIFESAPQKVSPPSKLTNLAKPYRQKIERESAADNRIFECGIFGLVLSNKTRKIKGFRRHVSSVDAFIIEKIMIRTLNCLINKLTDSNLLRRLFSVFKLHLENQLRPYGGKILFRYRISGLARQNGLDSRLNSQQTKHRLCMARIAPFAMESSKFGLL